MGCKLPITLSDFLALLPAAKETGRIAVAVNGGRTVNLDVDQRGGEIRIRLPRHRVS